MDPFCSGISFLIEKSFSYLQLLSACFVAFAHGANDVANAVGPVSAILAVLKDPANLHLNTRIPMWLLAFGGAGIVIGLATFGWRVVETIGKKIGRRDLIRLGDLPAQKNEPPILVADTKKITKEVGWAPRFDINKGLDLTIQWWKNKL